ncbi:lasso peptide biosynthesis B2 protein [Metabacillus sp. Hm71]|uniref:lasso peptide biosynthesis B2 protein n=1 Tax=Metabacillus sp. Hm71 TaxID=3450743 RepID=UPI003F4346D8
MDIFRKLRTLFSLDWKTILLFYEAIVFLGWARILKLMPFPKVAPKLGVHMEETSLDGTKINKIIVRDISEAIQIMSRYTLWESQCLVKAIAAMKMLEKRQIESTLYLGTARDQNGELIAHAWLRSGPYYITGFEEMHKFTVVGKFAKKLGGNSDD